MTIKQIADLIPMAHAVALVGENVRVAKKKNKKSGDLVKLGMTNIIGTGFIRVESNIIGNL